MRFFTIKIILLLGAVLLWGSTAPAQQCELDRPIMFAGLDWDSNAFHTGVASFIMQKGYGCKTDSIPGSTLPLLTGMARGDVDITMEIWKDNVTLAWNKAEKAGQVKDLGINFPDAIQGWFVPAYLQKANPGLKSVSDLPKFKKLFTDPEEPSKGRFYNCILGWGCEVVNTNKLKAYKLEEHYTNFRPGTGAALAAAIASNYKRNKPFVAYYWGPTWVLGQFDLVMLEEPPYNEHDWLELAKTKGNSAPVAYPVVKVTVGVNAKFYQAAPKLVEFLTKYNTSNKLVSQALAYMQQTKGASATDAALNFLRKRPDVWEKWVPADEAGRVKRAL